MFLSLDGGTINIPLLTGMLVVILWDVAEAETLGAPFSCHCCTVSAGLSLFPQAGLD